jgi:dTDP-glucose 4,6-dehydratase
VAKAPDLTRAHVLVTGGAGFIGSNFVHHLRRRFPGGRITVLDKLTYAGNVANLDPVKDAAGFLFIRGDICDPPTVARAMADADVVVNFAAETHVDRSIEDASSFVLTDTFGVYVLLEQARRAGVKRFVQISTDEVYGEVMEGAADEDYPLHARNPYAASKIGGDRLAYAYAVTHGVPAVVTRCSNNYGPYQYPEKMIPLFVTNAIEDKPLPVYGTGKNTRDWIHVEDHCRAIVAILEADDVEGETFNIAGGNERNVLDIAAIILERLKKPQSLLKHVTDRPAHDRRYAIDATRLTKKTGFEPESDFARGIEATIDWYVANRPWWEAIRSGAFQQYYERTYGSR